MMRLGETDYLRKMTAKAQMQSRPNNPDAIAYWQSIQADIRRESQRDAAKAAQVCPKCSGKGILRRDLPLGHPDFGKSIKCDGEAHLPERLARLGKASQLLPSEMDILLSDIKPYEADITDGHCPSCRKINVKIRLEDYQFDYQTGWQCPRCHLVFYGNPSTNKPMLAWAKKFIGDSDTPPIHGFGYCWGGSGNGKSEAAKAIVNECHRQNRVAVYTNYSRILRRIRESFSGNGESEMVKFDEYVNCEVLVIDELDKPTETKWANALRYDLLDERHNKSLRGGKFTTLIFSNKPPEQALDVALFSRSRQDERSGRIVHNTAPDIRAIMGYE